MLPDVMVVAGDGPLAAEIDASAAKLPGRFTRVSVTPDKMPALYRSADVFSSSPKDESFGNVFTEAMACGVPIVGLDSPWLRWIVGNDKFLVTNDGPEELAAFSAVLQLTHRSAVSSAQKGPMRSLLDAG